MNVINSFPSLFLIHKDDEALKKQKEMLFGIENKLIEQLRFKI